MIGRRIDLVPFAAAGRDRSAQPRGRWEISAPVPAGLLHRCVWGAITAAAMMGTAIADEPAVAEAPDVAPDPASAGLPPPLTAYKGREIAPTMGYAHAGWLIRESREQEEDCTMMLEALHLKAGQTVCDMGCGNGFYTLKMAKLVGPQGKVLAVDIQPEMLHMLSERGKAEGMSNIKPIQGTPINPNLPDESVDLILLVDVYHEFAYPEQMLRGMRRSLKPDGRLALVEFRREDRNVPIKLLHKMTKKQILKEFEPNGYKVVEEFEKLPWQHLMFFGLSDAQVTAPQK